MSSRMAAIRAVTSHFPETKLTNDQLAQEFGDWSADKIFEKTGISTRYVVTAQQCASDLGVGAAHKLFATGVCQPEEIDFLLFCTQSPDYFLPATSCIMQAQLGLRTDCGAIDVNQGCSGFVYGLSLAKGLIETQVARNVLFITADTYSKFINPRDRSVRSIFGDAGTATLVSAVDSGNELLGPFVFGTDGRGRDHLIVRAGAMRHPPTTENGTAREAEGGNWRSEQQLFMNGPEVFNFTIRVVPELIHRVLSVANMQFEAVDHFVFHQANKFMLDYLQRKMKIPPNKFPICLEQQGNTVSCTIPLTLESCVRSGVVSAGQKVLLAGFGVGLSWAGCMMKISHDFIAGKAVT